MSSRKGSGEIALGLVLLGVLVGLALVAQDHWKQGLSLMGVTLLAAAAARLLLPASRVGLLVVRSRSFDVATLAVLGVAILGVTFQVPLPHR
jgi:Protein of unknown function (DUF3017)